MNKKLNCILLIDDDEPTNFLNRMTVEEVGCVSRIEVMQDPHDALAYLKCAHQPKTTNADCPKPELIFLDINMPAMDGWEFLQHYQQLPDNDKKSVIVIMLTTSSNPEDEWKARNLPSVSEFKNKPLSAEMLREILHKYYPEVC